MGLDQYAYVAAKAGARDEYYEEKYEKKNQNAVEPRELAYWRKHPNLQGFMEKLWLRKTGYPVNRSDQEIEGKIPRDFNGVELELTWEDLDELERAVTHGHLPQTQGFFFGSNADDDYRAQDLAFIRNARAELFVGLKVFYNSSW